MSGGEAQIPRVRGRTNDGRRAAAVAAVARVLDRRRRRGGGLLTKRLCLELKKPVSLCGAATVSWKKGTVFRAHVDGQCAPPAAAPRRRRHSHADGQCAPPAAAPRRRRHSEPEDAAVFRAGKHADPRSVAVAWKNGAAFRAGKACRFIAPPLSLGCISGACETYQYWGMSLGYGQERVL